MRKFHDLPFVFTIYIIFLLFDLRYLTIGTYLKYNSKTTAGNESEYCLLFIFFF